LCVLIASVVSVAAWPTSPARGDTTSDLNAARKVYADALAVATAATDELIAAETRYDAIQSRIADLQAGIDQSRQRMGALQVIVKGRAVFAYTHAGAGAIDPIFTGASPSTALRRNKYLTLANAQADRAISELDALRSDLRVQQDELQAQRDREAPVKAALEAKAKDLQGQLDAAQKARDALAAKLAAERSAAAQAERARLLAANPSVSGSPGQIIVNPGGGPFQCPVSGAAYNDNYGPRGSGFHSGIDMFVATGTPEVAVKAGSVRYVANEGDGGNTAYLSADDGNVYFYAHLSAFVGGARSVAQGEVIGRAGMTGNASAPHLHFEIRIGGANGQRIDPFPTLQAAGC
jgi:murein DD-endopeptidase MepM/ murein hydrolase activator NlpD